MHFSERQVTMLEAMGLKVWTRPLPPQATAAPSLAPEPRAFVPDAAPRGLAAAHVQAPPAPGHPEAAALRVRPAPPARREESAVEHVVRPPVPGGAVSTLDWAELRDTVAGCTACALCQGRTQTVFGVGHERAHWMVVGEAPGEQEDRLGEPFVGKSGQLLDNMLRAVGLSREPGPAERQVYIANTVKCRPPGNRNPEAVELATCEPYLVRQIALVQPRVILAMGRFAVQSLLRSTEPIGRLRGRVHTYEGVPLVVTYHPAYLLRNPEDKARAWDDLCLAREVLANAAH